jgi:hypothetical protein
MPQSRITPWALAKLLGEAGLADETLEMMSYALIIQWPRPDGYRTNRVRFVNYAKTCRERAAA